MLRYARMFLVAFLLLLEEAVTAAASSPSMERLLAMMAELQRRQAATDAEVVALRANKAEAEAELVGLKVPAFPRTGPNCATAPKCLFGNLILAHDLNLCYS